MFISKDHEAAYKLLQNTEYEKAVKKYSACILAHPHAPDLYSERGVAYIHLKEKEKSLADLNKSVDLQPDYAYRYSSRGHAKDFFGDTDGAIEDYEIAAEMDPNDSIVYNNLGLLLEKKGNMMMAKSHYDRSDELRKQEEELLSTVDELERGPVPLDDSPIEANSNHSENRNEETKSNTSSEVKRIFTEKSQWREFLRFIKNGFRIK
jgi:tetratricopeptide (TPR) repeat protein